MEDKMLYKDASQPVEVRVEDLLSRMTLEEKAAQLSYTQFAVENLEISKKEVSTDGQIEISCSVSNIGDVAGDEVVQLYQTFHLDTAQLGYYNEEMEFVVESGSMDIMVGTCSEELPLRDTVQLTGKKVNVMGRRVYTCPVEIA